MIVAILPADQRVQLSGTDQQQWTASQIVAALQAAGATDAETRQLFGIAWLESGFQVGAFNRNTNGSTDRGPWQINDRAWPDISDQDAHQLDTAARAAVRVLRTQGPGAWVVWRSKRAQVDAAAQSAPIGKPGPDGRSVPAPPNAAGGGGGGSWNPATPSVGVRDAYGTAVAIVADRLPGPLGDVVEAGGKVGSAVIGTATSAISPFGGLVDAAGTALRLLTSREFWRRAGSVALGVLVAIIGLALILRQPAQKAATMVAATQTGGMIK